MFNDGRNYVVMKGIDLRVKTGNRRLAYYGGEVRKRVECLR